MALRRTSTHNSILSSLHALMSSRTRSGIQGNRFRIALRGLRNDKSSAGFTLIELLVVIGIFTILTTLGLFLSFDFYRTYSFNAERSTLVSVLTKARSQSLVNIDGQEHGVHVEAGKYVAFQDDAPAMYTDGDANNLVIPTGSATTVTGDTEIVFERLTGKARRAGGSACGDDTNPCEITLSAQSISKIVTINSEGRIDW